ncbi:MAG: serine/threonine protein kinase [Symploca sp. SIO2E6]|nr:serine/threonine protein kinase [Symploca sp. SIO2E6]
MNLTPGTTIRKGKYILDTQLGTGFFSLTYRATSKSAQTVVIKTLAENLCQHSDYDRFKQQFLELAQKLRHCQHPYLVSVLDYFEEAGRPYLVMEYIPGQTLAQIIQTQALPERKALKYIHQIGDALSSLHQFGLLHRDIKPQNIILRQDTDYVVLCELGITCELTPGVMQTHASLLSSGYVPPEQYSLEYQRTKATDIYALAATFYCLLTGYPPLPVAVRKVLQAGGEGKKVWGNESADAETRGRGDAETRNPTQNFLHPQAGDKDSLFPSNSQPSPPQLSPEVMQAISCGLALAANQRPQTVEAWLALIPLPKRLRSHRDTSTPSQLKSDSFHQDTLVSSSPDTPTKQVPKAVVFKLPQIKSPLKALFMTSAIAASVGLGFGFALRFNRPDLPGSTILHTEQSFPPRSDWPVSEPSL